MPVYPVVIPKDFVSSQAEKSVLERFLESPYASSKDQYVFHSVRAQVSDNKKVGEVDFIYLDQECIIFLEVKGGVVKYSENTRKWSSGNNDTDPWKQVADYLFYVRDKLFKVRFKGDYFDQKLCFGYGVVFPDCKRPAAFHDSYCREEASGKRYDYELDLVYDSVDHTNRDTGIEDYLNRIKNYWKNHPSNKNRAGINREDFQTIKSYFSTDLVFKPVFSEVLESDEKQSRVLTQEQAAHLNTCLNNSSFNFLINGGPGSGKTVLGLELAYRFSNKGERVLYVAYNRPISDYLNVEKERLVRQQTLSNPDSLTISNIDRLMIQELKKSQRDLKIENTQVFWQNLTEKYLDSLDPAMVEKYDRVIIDEGQDMFNESMFTAIESFIDKGFDSGNWIILLDDEFQVLYTNRFNQDYRKVFIELYRPLTLPLSFNCRNSLNIAQEAQDSTGMPIPECIKPPLFETQIKWYNKKNDLLEIVRGILYQLRNWNASNRFISIITDTAELRDFFITSIGVTRSLDVLGKENRNDYVLVDTDRRFKGLDNEIVIYVCSNFDPDNKEAMARMYVAITRARARLTMVLNSKDKVTFDKARMMNIFNAKK